MFLILYSSMNRQHGKCLQAWILTINGLCFNIQFSLRRASIEIIKWNYFVYSFQQIQNNQEILGKTYRNVVVFSSFMRGCNMCKILNNFLGVLCFPSTWFTSGINTITAKFMGETVIISSLQLHYHDYTLRYFHCLMYFKIILHLI